MRLYTVSEVAQLLRISKRTVYSYIACGYLRAIQVNERKAIRIPEDALQEFLQKNQTVFSAVQLPKTERVIKLIKKQKSNNT